jgi:hypothetical protein
MIRNWARDEPASIGHARRDDAELSPLKAQPRLRRYAAALIFRAGNNRERNRMSTFDDRERSFEAKFARDEEMAFRITARRNRLLGTWAAGLMGLTAEEGDAYCKAVVQADFEEAGDEDVIRKLLGDLVSAGVEMDDSRIRSALHDATVEARRQLFESQ